MSPKQKSPKNPSQTASKLPKKPKSKKLKKSEEKKEKLDQMKSESKSSWTKGQWIEFAQLMQEVSETPVEEVDAATPIFDDEEEDAATKATGAKQKEASDAGAEVSDGEDVPVKPSKNSGPKLVPPKKKYGGGKSEDFDAWMRSIRIWSSKYPTYSSHELGAELMEVIEGDAEGVVFARVQEGEETFEEIMTALLDAYGKKSMPKATEYTRAFSNCRRGKKQLREFLNEYVSLRAKAMAAGEQMCDNTSGTKLLEAAELSAALHAQMLTNVVREPDSMSKNGLPRYENMMRSLDMLAQSYEAGDSKREKTVLMTERKGGTTGKDGGKGKGKNGKGGKGKGGKGKGKGKGGKGAGKGAGKGKGKGGKGDAGAKLPCWDFQAKKCWRGDSCRFSHEKEDERGQKRERPSGEEDPPAKRDRPG